MTALHGIKVLELAESVSGEYCGKLLSDFGAEIIKVEKPGYGSPTRSLGPFGKGNAGTENSGLFAYLNTSKRSIELDLTSKDGRATLQRALQHVHAVIDDHSADWLAEMGLDAETTRHTHPALIVCSISNFGLMPPEDRLHTEDLNVFHSSGWGYHTPTGGDSSLPPLNGAGRFLPSYEAGIDAALCIAAALYEQTNSGLGQFIEISKQEVLLSRIDYVLAQMLAGEMNIGTDRNAFDLTGPAGIFPCKNGFIYIWLSTPAHWEGLRGLLDDTAWMSDFPDNWLERECTPERVESCRHHITEWLRTQDKHEAAEKAQKLGVTLVAVNNAQDLLESPQYQHRKFFVELNHPVLGDQKYPTVPYQLSATPAKPTKAAPLLGQDNHIGLRALTNTATGRTNE
jgi:crotonobetainyl-CoA:carnitine CoA-transferase CaiB-like acyl-CoA transferase